MLTTTGTHSLRALAFFDWYALPGSSPQTPMAAAIAELDLKKGNTVLDPFCGTGAGLLSARFGGLNALGVEANPFLRFAACVKNRRDWNLPLLRRDIDALMKRAAVALDTIDQDGDLQWTVAGRMPQMPRLETWVSRRVLLKVLTLQACIEECVAQEHRDLPLLALVSVLRGASHMKLSPHAYGSRETKPYSPVLYHLDAKLRKMLADLEWLERREGAGHITVLEGDVRDPHTLARPGNSAPAALAVGSPPDLSEQDPTAQTRLELFFLGCVHNIEELGALRKRISYHEAPGGAVRVRDVTSVERLALMAEENGHAASAGVIRAYFENLQLALEGIRSMLAPDAPLFMTLGESVQGGVRVPAPDLAAELGHLTGFSRAEVRVLRTRRHPGLPGGLKESTIVLK